MTAQGQAEAYRQRLERLVRWVREAALPVWSRAAFDEARGGFHESLDFAGRPAPESFRRVRVQARQIHIFSTATRLGWLGGERLARAGFSYFAERACPDGGRRGCVHRLAPDGSVLDDRRDLYDQAFLLLACASYYRAFRDEVALDLAASTLAFLDRDLASAAGGYQEDDLGTLPRRQNPHMHLFEALLALYEATGETDYFRRAEAILRLLQEKFLDPQDGALLEFFDENWRPHPAQGDILEPGHMAEWVWLLERFEKAGGEAPRGLGAALLRRAEETGLGGAGFLVDQARRGEEANGPRRLWPQTEYVKALTALSGAGDATAPLKAVRLIDRLFETYLAEPVAGLWCDRYDAQGARLAQDVPASMLYHLFDAALQAQAQLETS